MKKPKHKHSKGPAIHEPVAIEKATKAKPTLDDKLRAALVEGHPQKRKFPTDEGKMAFLKAL